MNNNRYDLIVIGSGAAGMIASIIASREGKSVALFEQQENLGPKIKATGGGRCNLSNTLDNSDFMNSFGRNGRFMMDAINMFDHKSLISFLSDIGVETHIPDGFRIFPTTHKSQTIIDAFEKEINRLEIDIYYNTKVERLICESDEIIGVETSNQNYLASNIIVATGGLGFPILGANGDGFQFAKSLGHKVTDLYPAMIPLFTKETWVANCKADTIAKAELRINLPKAKKLKATGDLIFTSKGIRGPVVLDFSREITPFLEKYDEVPLLINMVRGKNQEEIRSLIKKDIENNPTSTILDNLSTFLPLSVAKELCLLVGIDITKRFKEINGTLKDELIKVVVSTPLTVTGSAGFKQAMITRGGVSLKEINPKTMESKIIKGLYFCGEVIDLDGPCGGYNLQWSFSSGFLAGHLFT